MPARVAADERWMTRALELARRAEGLTRPNPPVGAVVVRAGRLVGEGYHRRAGGAHAEVEALRRAGGRARAATLYVTLEPCSTWGRTPPCTRAILAAGVRRVVVSVRDPNPKHAGRGLRLLRARGVEVTEGILAAKGAELLAPFAKWITTGRPWVTLKLGMTLDGRLADARGQSRWITGPPSRRRVHELRRRADAILVGTGTVLADNPSLLPVPSLGRRPLRVIVDARGRVPLRSRAFADGRAGQTLVITTSRSSARYRDRLRRQGVQVAIVPAGKTVDPRHVLRELGKRGLLHVVCEGGGRWAASMVRAQGVDEFWLFAAPRLLGGDAVAALAGAGWPLASAPRLRILEVERVGDDVWIRARPED